MKILLINISFFILIATPIFAATIDTLDVYSSKMEKYIKTIVVKPDSYEVLSGFPVLYLLHGHGGSYNGLIKKSPQIMELADLYEMMIVCPDGGLDSWYWDSPIDSTYRYETFISKELVSCIDKRYKTIPSRESRAITGISMGGHGALYVAFRNQDTFGACGSISGGVDIRPFPNNWGMSKYIGKQSEHPEYWEKYTVIKLLYLLTANRLKIIIDCGSDDFLFQANEKLHRMLLYRGIPHDYISRPGAHNWQYWENAIKFQILFFKEFFYVK